MAFATTNVKSSVFGNQRVLVGDWTGDVGDAAGTVEFAGGRVYLAKFTDQDGTAPYQIEIPVKVTITGSVATVTVYNQSSVTTGRFIIVGA